MDETKNEKYKTQTKIARIDSDGSVCLSILIDYADTMIVFISFGVYANCKLQFVWFHSMRDREINEVEEMNE